MGEERERERGREIEGERGGGGEMKIIFCHVFRLNYNPIQHITLNIK